jgi:glucan biosynthesis protein C
MSEPIRHVPRQRTYYVDWLRILAVLLLVPYHAAMIFVPWTYHVKNAETSLVLEVFNRFLGIWQMPLLFFIAGAGTWFALGHRTALEYVTERVRRLLVPLAFGMLVIVPPQTYLERLQQGRFHGSFLDFYPHFFEGVYPAGNLTWNHLWFLAYLFVFSLLLLPFFLWARGEGGRNRVSRLTSLFRTGPSLLLLAIPPMAVQACLRVRWPGEQNLIDDWANFFFYITMFAYGYIVFAAEGVMDRVARNRWLFLGIGFLGVLVVAVVEHSGAAPRWGYNVGCITYLAFTGFNTWSWVLAILGFARIMLDRAGPRYAYATTASLPFYILHQTVIVIIGYHVVRWEVGVLTKFVVVTVSSLVGIVAVYEVLVRRLGPLRFLFGMRPGGPR